MYLSEIDMFPFALLDEIVELGSEQLSGHVVISGAGLLRTWTSGEVKQPVNESYKQKSTGTY